MRRLQAILATVAMLGAADTLAQEITPPPVMAANSPTMIVVRTYSPEGLDRAIAEAQLIALPAEMSREDALVEMVAEFVPEFGQATNLVPMNVGAGGMSSILYQFRDQRSVIAMVHADRPAHLTGPFGCRVIANAGAGTPDRDKFARIIHWCSTAVTLSNLDPAAVVRHSR